MSSSAFLELERRKLKMEWEQLPNKTNLGRLQKSEIKNHIQINFFKIIILHAVNFVSN